MSLLHTDFRLENAIRDERSLRSARYVDSCFFLLPLQTVMSDPQPARSWRAVARELAKETIQSRKAELRQELNRALEEEAPIQVTPYEEGRFLPIAEIVNPVH